MKITIRDNVLIYLSYFEKTIYKMTTRKLSYYLIIR